MSSGLSLAVLDSLGFVASVGMGSLDASVSRVPAFLGSPVVSRAFVSPEVAGVWRGEGSTALAETVSEIAGKSCPDAESEVADDFEADVGAGAVVGAVSDVGAVGVAPAVAGLGGLVLDGI